MTVSPFRDFFAPFFPNRETGTVAHNDNCVAHIFEFLCCSLAAYARVSYERIPDVRRQNPVGLRIVVFAENATPGGRKENNQSVQCLL